jgi:hypothetical protein
MMAGAVQTQRRIPAHPAIGEAEDDDRRYS